MEDKTISPLETYYLLCRAYVDDLNRLENKHIAKDYFYNRKYEVGFKDKETGKIGYIADIETALKETEMEHTLRVRLENANYELVRKEQANEKQLKALEIIKNKRVNVDFLLDCKTLEQYNYSCLQYELDRQCLTQEEYDLLKEVIGK